MLHGRPKEVITAAFIQLKYLQTLTESIFIPLKLSLMSEWNDLVTNKSYTGPLKNACSEAAFPSLCQHNRNIRLSILKKQ